MLTSPHSLAIIDLERLFQYNDYKDTERASIWTETLRAETTKRFGLRLFSAIYFSDIYAVSYSLHIQVLFP